MKRLSTDAEYLNSGKLVLDADGIPFEPASKGYVDQRVPIDSFTGTGSPEGKVTAPVGSVYTDTAATTGAIRWIKTSGTGNTGWVVEYGDTGWRDIAGSSTAISGELRIRRTENIVYLAIVDARFDVSSGSQVITLPTGFRPQRFTYGQSTKYWDPEASRPGRIRDTGIVEFRPLTAGDVIKWDISFATTNPWPATLPGTPA